MITYVDGNLFSSPAQVLVNTVNTVGVMGRGVAKEFKRIYPDMFARYRDLCDRGRIDIGKLWLYKTPNKWILNFPTKKHWRHPSKPEYIESGLKKFVQIYSESGIHSIASPPLGCGNGELDFETTVKPLMEQYLKNLPIGVFMYPDRQDPYPPEHQTPEEIRKWLHSEPESLSFQEVWEDVRDLLSKQQSFKTLKKKSPFEAVLNDEPEGIRITARKRTRVFHKNDLLDFWQQIRSYGFSVRSIVPNGLEKEFSYLIPIFAQLEYVKPMILSESYRHNPSIGLQYLPRINPRQSDLFSSLSSTNADAT